MELALVLMFKESEKTRHASVARWLGGTGATTAVIALGCFLFGGQKFCSKIRAVIAQLLIDSTQCLNALTHRRGSLLAVARDGLREC